MQVPMNNYSKIKVFLVIIFILLFSVTTLLARNSPYTQKSSGPMYWIAYEYCWQHNTAIPEARWKANIDWINEHFKSCGYDMVCNDGWIEAAQTINSDGYIAKYNNDWEHGFDYWTNYLSERGMKLGIYYNPLWITKKAYDQNVKVKGANYRARDIAGAISFNDSLYWVDTNRPGAKEWVQEYVKYFIGTGATYLRIDFLENYEKNYGTTGYIRALEWIEEAAGDKLFLSLVMPNCYDHGKNELKYGDMIRIDDDCFDGGWDFVSDRRRGEHRPVWPQYGNAFDGFIAFSDIGGKGQLILDGDFMRLNTLANDDERMFLFSLMVITGSALAIADQYDSIDGYGWVYKNTELIELNKLGLACKPISNDVNDTGNSSRWIGQLPDGNWVVGLFNRENTLQTRKIDFEKELGITGGKVENVRDLWSHTDSGPLSGEYAVELKPHSCKIIKIQ